MLTLAQATLATDGRLDIGTILPRSKDGVHFETVLQYADWIQTQPQLTPALRDLKGCTLVCDRPRNRLCHGEKAGQSPSSWSGPYRPSRWVQAVACRTRMVSIVIAFKAWCWFAT